MILLGRAIVSIITAGGLVGSGGAGVATRDTSAVRTHQSDSTSAHPSRTLLGGVIGAAVGTTAGYLLSRSITLGCKTTLPGPPAQVPSCDPSPPRNLRIAVTVSGTVVGAIVGAVVGHFVRR
jgi:hypothetical protein